MLPFKCANHIINQGKFCNDVMTWKCFLHRWPFVRGIHLWPMDFPHIMSQESVSMSKCHHFPMSAMINSPMSGMTWNANIYFYLIIQHKVAIGNTYFVIITNHSYVFDTVRYLSTVKVITHICRLLSTSEKKYKRMIFHNCANITTQVSEWLSSTAFLRWQTSRSM